MRTAAICPTCATYTNAVCVLYDGPYLSNLDINPLTDLEEVIGIIDAKFGTLSVPTLQQVTDADNVTTNAIYSLDNALTPTVQASLQIDSISGLPVVLLEDLTNSKISLLSSEQLSFTNGAAINTVNVKATNVAGSIKNVELPNASGNLALSVNGTGANTSGDIDLPYKQVKVSLSSAQILTLGSVPVTLIPAQGAGKVIIPISVVLDYKFVTSGYSTNTNVFITSASSPTSITRTGALAFASDACTFDTPINSGASNALTGNESLQISTGAGNPTGGDSTLDVYVTYVVITI